MKSNTYTMSLGILSVTLGIVFSCQEQDADTPVDDPAAVFTTFGSTEQTLSTVINRYNKTIRFEVGHEADVTQLVPNFTVPIGYSVLINGTPQVSGQTKVDFTSPVSYTLKNNDGQATSWQAEAVPLQCKILIDASHDGGIWWFPQYSATGYNQDAPHQGQYLANAFREKGFEVTELGRDRKIAEELFFGYYIVIRFGGFEAYEVNEVAAYRSLVERGANLVLTTDHKNNDPTDEIAELLNLDFQGTKSGVITTFADHDITAGMTSLDYIAGSVLTNLAEHHDDIEVLGWLNFEDSNHNGIRDEGESLEDPVMGILHLPKSKVFFIGESNGLEVQPQPFIDNLINWMGLCFQP